ncbi:hypothetical protein OIE63_00270 [Streptomyces sp. NBC_01795]|uniref:hypothetical protein n=1 Tax=unclassified Streptomyces TaxID=2593676 RepID=UPI002DDB68DE|nr:MULTISPECIES: hypothetical protein [unclassified Streptomyces]WSA90135.1 hypothetical protein OIE63_00270 [Streptomyces sp. NBC_01795]WSS17253.1 hypothetical protein OG533_39125 [Streptomyces sp. NBC_01186]
MTHCPYNNGYTSFRGRSLVLATGKLYDRSAAKLYGAHKGDKVWVTISPSKGKNWASCGHKSAKKGSYTVTSKAYQHSSSDVKGRYMRACAKTDGKVWCADNGNKSNRKHSDNKKRYWWTDS